MNTLSAYEQVASQFTPNEQEVISGFNCFSRRNQIMRYITVEDLSFYYDKEPVLEHTNYSVDSGGVCHPDWWKWGCQDDSYQGESRYFATKIWQGNHLKTNTHGGKAKDAYLPQQIASFNAGFPKYQFYEFGKSDSLSEKGLVPSFEYPRWGSTSRPV